MWGSSTIVSVRPGFKRHKLLGCTFTRQLNLGGSSQASARTGQDIQHTARTGTQADVCKGVLPSWNITRDWFVILIDWDEIHRCPINRALINIECFLRGCQGLSWRQKALSWGAPVTGAARGKVTNPTLHTPSKQISIQIINTIIYILILNILIRVYLNWHWELINNLTGVRQWQNKNDACLFRPRTLTG